MKCSLLESVRNKNRCILSTIGKFNLSLFNLCPKNRKNRGFLRFPLSVILTILRILRTATFAIFTCYGVKNRTDKPVEFYYLKFDLRSNSCMRISSVLDQ